MVSSLHASLCLSDLLFVYLFFICLSVLLFVYLFFYLFIYWLIFRLRNNGPMSPTGMRLSPFDSDVEVSLENASGPITTTYLCIYLIGISVPN